MKFTPEDAKKFKAMLMYAVKKCDEMSGGSNGFHLIYLRPILEELEKEGKIEKRETINRNDYFLKK